MSGLCENSDGVDYLNQISAFQAMVSPGLEAADFQDVFEMVPARYYRRILGHLIVQGFSRSSWMVVAITIDCYELFLALLTIAQRRRSLFFFIFNTVLHAGEHIDFMPFLERAIRTDGIRVPPDLLFFVSAEYLRAPALLLLINGGLDPSIVRDPDNGGWIESAVTCMDGNDTPEILHVLLQHGLPLKALTGHCGGSLRLLTANYTIYLAYGGDFYTEHDRQPHLVREVYLMRVRQVRPHAKRLGFALQNLRLPALVLVEILDNMDRLAPLVPFHVKWNIVTCIKHNKR
mgnify:CR=1 FL=1